MVVGRVGRAVGLRGEVEVLIVSDHPDRFVPGSVVLTAADSMTLTVANVRSHGERTIVRFDEISDRTAAESLKGAELAIPAAAARALDENEYWDHDLVGSRVVDMIGTPIGTVTDVLHQPAHEVLLVEEGDRHLLIPLVGEIVKDVRDGRITIDPPQGLLD